jgi:response regulator of citrate/malate metabolism
MKTKKNLKVVIVEDDLYYNKALTKYLQSVCSSSIYPEFNFEIKSYTNAHDCIEELDDDTSIMVLDYYLINEEETDVLTGADIVKEANEHCGNCHIIMISAQESPHNTSELLRLGVYDYVDKNVNSKNRLGAVMQRLINEKFRDQKEAV